MNYPFKFPFASIMGRLGATLTITINVYRDDEAKVYVATNLEMRMI